MDFKEQLFQFFEVSEEQVNTMLATFVEEDLKKGNFFLAQGDRCNRLSFIQSGIFRVFAETADKEVTQWIGNDGYFITDLSSFLFDGASRYSIQALTDAKIFSLYKKDYRTFEQSIPNWNILEKRFIAKCFIQIEHRVFDFIALSAEERYLKYFEQHKALFNQVPLQYIASSLGMSPETLSRIRAKLSS